MKLCGKNVYFQCHLIKNRVINKKISKCMSSGQLASVSENEYTAVPEYPDIIDPSTDGRKLRERKAWYKKIKQMPTVEEKLLEISVQKRYWVHNVTATGHAYGMQPFQQHATRTHLIQGLPEEYNSMNVDSWVEKLRLPLLDCIQIELEHRGKGWKRNDKSAILEDKQTKLVIKNMMSVIMAAGIDDYEHLLTAQIQDLPRLSYYWWNGKFYGRFKKRPTEYDTACFQCDWTPAFQICCENPLPVYLERDDPLCTESDIPEFPFKPSIWRLQKNFRHLACVPGYWPGTKTEYPLITFETRYPLWDYRHRNKDESYVEKIIDGIGIMGMFGSLGAVASYHGFTPYHELTYPLTSQLVITDGQTWTFLTYQLNTISFHPDVATWSHCNVCWSSGPMKLYEAFEEGQLKGVNDQVLSTLLKFFFRTPAIREGLEMKPYLAEDKRELEEIQTCRANLRKLFDNRPSVNLTRDETPTWHWVYKKNPLAAPTPNIKLW